MATLSRYHWILSAVDTRKVSGLVPSKHNTGSPMNMSVLSRVVAVTSTVSLVAQPPPALVVVIIYSVVTAVVATGLAIVGSLNPATGLQEPPCGRILALDGCEDACALKKLRETGVEPDLHIVATECGIVKNGMEEPRFDEIERLAAAVLEAIRR